MKLFLRKLYAGKLFPLSWTFITIFLLCLPGSAIPGAGIASLQKVDKIVHVILFGGIVRTWGLYIRKTYAYPQRLTRIVAATLFSIGLGIILEFVQRDYISNRSFDVNDIIADTIGAVSVFIYFIIIKKPL